MSGFFKVPNEVYDAFAKSDPLAVEIYLCLSRNAAYDTKQSPMGYELRRGECDLTMDQVAREVGCSKSAVRNRYAKLTNIGTMVTRRATQRRNVISLVCGWLEGDAGTETERTAHSKSTQTERTRNETRTLSKKKTNTKTNTNDSEPSAQAKTPGEFIDNSIAVPPPWHETIADRLTALCTTQVDRGSLCRLANELANKTISGKRVGRQRVEDMLTTIEASPWRAHGGADQLRSYITAALQRGADKPSAFMHNARASQGDKFKGMK